MPNRCVVHGCSNTPNVAEGIGLHRIPFAEDNRTEAKKRRKRWIDFVNKRRKYWVPSKLSALCSAHFEPEDFVRRFTVLPGQVSPYLPRLKYDEIGIVSFPSVYPELVDKKKPVSS